MAERPPPPQRVQQEFLKKHPWLLLFEKNDGVCLIEDCFVAFPALSLFLVN